MSKPYILLTQDNCPNCERLKRMLAGPLKNKYADRIETVHRQALPDRFAHLVLKHEVRQAPALICTLTGEKLHDTSSIQEVNAFLLE